MPNRIEYWRKPYGAIELKMTYQRNLLAANLLVLALVTAIVTTSWLLASGDDIIIRVPPNSFDPPDTVIVNLPLGQNFSVIPEGRPRPAAHSDARGAIPVPVPDSIIVDDRTILTTADYGVEQGTTGHDFHDSLPDGYGEGIIETEDFPDYGIFIKVEKAPEFIIQTKPEYPIAARRLGIDGMVAVAALVGVDGTVREVKVVKSSGSEALDEAALASALKSLFTPAVQNGRPIAVWVTYNIEFVLDH